VSEVLSRIRFDTLGTDDDLAIDRLTTDLAVALTQAGSEAKRPRLEPSPGDKGAGELVLATLNVLTSADPAQIEAMVRVLVGFVRRNDGRRVHVRIDDNELTIDRPTEQQADELIAIYRSAVKPRKH